MGLKAPTPAPHTPVTYLKGGGAGMFSAECATALIKANINPEWCGSYAHVSENVIRPAKKKCEAWDNASDGERDSGNLDKPTAEDRYLASCQSGHLVRDSCFRNPGEPGEGGTRGDPCENMVDGYVSRQAPSIPQQGHAADSEGQHGAHTRMEEDQAASRNAAGQGNPYTPDNRQADEDARVEAHVKRHPGDFERVEEETKNQPDGTDRNQGAMGSDASSVAATDNAAAGTQQAAATEPDGPGVEKITGADAAECLNNWRKAAEQEMYDKVQADAARNQKYADAVMAREGCTTPAATRKKLQAKVADAEDALRDAIDDGASPDEIERARRRVTASKARETRFCNARCLTEQGGRIGTSAQRTNGRAA